MAYFSWLKADNETEIANIASGLPFKCLIPEKFDNTGVGYIYDIYRNFGFLGQPTEEQLNNPEIKDYQKKGRYDLFELVAVWNSDYVTDTEIGILDKKFPAGTRIGSLLRGVTSPMKEIDGNTEYNRLVGCAIYGSDRDKEKVDFPLKLVSDVYRRSYEKCMGLSYSDPEKGCRLTRERLYHGGSPYLDHRYDGMKWHDVFIVWEKIEEMRFGEKHNDFKLGKDGKYITERSD